VAENLRVAGILRRGRKPDEFNWEVQKQEDEAKGALERAKYTALLAGNRRLDK
jgi:hypothetical protein